MRLGEGVFAKPVDVLESGEVPIGPQLGNRFLHIAGIPDDHGVGEQAQAAHDLLVGLFLVAARHPIAPKPEPAAQSVQLLPSVELGIDLVV